MVSRSLKGCLWAEEVCVRTISTGFIGDMAADTDISECVYVCLTGEKEGGAALDYYFITAITKLKGTSSQAARNPI